MLVQIDQEVEKNREDILDNIVTGDELWVHHYEHGYKQNINDTKKIHFLQRSSSVCITVEYSAGLFEKLKDTVRDETYGERTKVVLPTPKPVCLEQGSVLSTQCSDWCPFFRCSYFLLICFR